ncbi:MAG: M20/M25/M40 family metallo-hydrolase [Anaerolineae bacterium]|nr:M20/M25/M40 family metallo-hydrolase [Anaerolineae bacterium]
MIENLRRQLRELVQIPGLSGHEDAIIRYCADQLRAHADEVRIDSLGNVIARFGDPSHKRIAVLAHLDTVGLMVKAINGDGTLKVVAVGGVNLKALPGTAVRVGDRPGVIGVRSQHLSQPGDAAVNIDDLYVDVGKDQAVAITTPITYAPNVVELGGNVFASPYLDNRAGCAVLLEVAQQIQRDGPCTIYLIGTVQEETTCAGAYHALADIKPDMALFVDGTVSYDTPDTRGRGSVMVGAGPVLTAFLYVSGLNGWHAHPVVRSSIKQTANAAGIPFQQDAIHGLMSDARVTTWLGVPSAIIGLPVRGKHAPLEVVHLDDLANAARLLMAILHRSLPDLARG